MQNWKAAIDACKEVLIGETGLNLSLGQIRAGSGKMALPAECELRSVLMFPKAVEWPPRRRVPVISIAVEKSKQLREQKSGNKQSLMQLTIQVISSHENSHTAHEQLSDYVEAICDVLFRNEGKWAQGLYYAGGWAVTVNPSGPGGMGYVQSAEIKFELYAYEETI
jgi:hypothetical protein